MGIPLEIRRVKRPVNTVITTNGTNSAKRYAVRERIGVKYIPGGNPQPIYGKIIGHIIDFKFVPKVSGGSEIQQDNEVYPDLLSWGGAAFLRTVSDDIVAQLTTGRVMYRYIIPEHHYLKTQSVLSYPS